MRKVCYSSKNDISGFATQMGIVFEKIPKAICFGFGEPNRALSSVEHPWKNTLSRSKDRPPPKEYPPRKVGVRGIPVVEDLAKSRKRLPPEEYPLRKVGSS